MEVHEFVKESLLQVMRGVRDAGSDWIAEAAANGIVHPSNTGPSFRNVEFDLSVVVTESKEAEGGAKISVFGQGIGGKGSKKLGTTSTSRIQFKVPVTLPKGVRAKAE